MDQGIAAGSITQVATDFQDGVPANYKTPLSVGLGGAYAFGPTRLHFSAEWFASQGAYHVLQTSTFTAQSSGEVLTNQVVQELEAVLNYGVGIEHRFDAKRGDLRELPHRPIAASRQLGRQCDDVALGPHARHRRAVFTWLKPTLVLGGDVAWGSAGRLPLTTRPRTIPPSRAPSKQAT